MDYIRLLPKNFLSRLVGRLAESEAPAPVARWARDWFIKRYKINMSEAELPLEQYACTAAMFTRRLKPGARPIGAGVVHPCDAVLTTSHKIEDDTLVQAKGKSYSLEALLATDTTTAAKYRGGWHMVYYLCPTDYHRVHSPVEGEVIKVSHVPGILWPVNDWSVNAIDSLFAVNERVIVWIRTSQGVVALVLVGATNVGKITLAFDPEVRSNVARAPRQVFEKNYDRPLPLKKGDEVGIFNMGSTVVMVYPPGIIDSNRPPKLGPTRLGESL